MHDPRSIKLFNTISSIDFNEFDDYFSWNSGEDGDNGEVLMNQLDLYFQREDEKIYDSNNKRSSKI